MEQVYASGTGFRQIVVTGDAEHMAGQVVVDGHVRSSVQTQARFGELPMKEMRAWVRNATAAERSAGYRHVVTLDKLFVVPEDPDPSWFSSWADECGKPLLRAGYLTSCKKEPGPYDQEMARTVREHGGFANGHIAAWPSLEIALECMEALGRPCSGVPQTSVDLSPDFRVDHAWRQGKSTLAIGPGWVAFDNGLYGTARLTAVAPLDGPGLPEPFVFDEGYSDMMKPVRFRIYPAHEGWKNAVVIENTGHRKRHGHTFLVVGFNVDDTKEWIARFPLEFPTPRKRSRFRVPPMKKEPEIRLTFGK